MKLVVVTPWYPTHDQPFGGMFVQDWTRARGLDPADVVIVHLQAVDAAAAPTRSESTDPIGRVIRVTVPLAPSVPRTAAAAAFERAARDAGIGEVLAGAAAVHLHVALPSGFAVLDLIDPSSVVALIEHASYTSALLTNDASARLYGRVVARAHVVLTAGRPLAAMLREAFPADAAKVMASGNPVDVASFPLEPREHQVPTRLLYVGNIIESKGVLRAVDALAAWRARHGHGELTLVGGGAAIEAVHDRAAALGVSNHVTVRAGGTRAEVARAMGEADVLVHLSDLETFGIAPLEAVCSGLPVVITRCGGPEQTLADAAAHGCAFFVKLAPEPEAVVDAIEAAVAAAPAAPWAGVRDRIALAFGASAFGARLARIEDGGQWPDSASPGAPVILIAAMGSVGNRRAVAAVDAALAAGALVDVVALEPDHIVLADRRAAQHVLWPRALRSPVRALEYVVVRAVPLAVLDAAIWVCARSPLSDDRGDGTVVRGLSKVRVRWRKGARWIHENVAERVWYQWTSSRPYARAALTRWPDVSTTKYDVIAYMDPKALHLAWTMAKRDQQATVLKHPSPAAVTAALRSL